MHIFGESYAGRYIPVFTEYLLHMNDQLEQSEDLRQRGFRHLPLRGIGIGNGLFDYALQAPSYYKMGCRSSYPPMFNARQCSTLKNTVNPQCISMLAQCYASNQEQSSEGMRQEGCVGIELERWRLTDACAAADSYCNGALNWTTPASTYDVRQGARIVPDDYVSLLRTNAFVEAVGASPTVMYQECSDSVFDLFASTTDEISRSAKSSLEYILSRQLPVLLYSGDADFICNWYGTVTVAKALEWQGKSRFANARINNWSWPAKNGTNVPAGQFLNADNLTFLRVYEAGHEVPFYQPEASLFMLMQFVTQRRLY
ncbi:hypothetical protein FBU59_004613 [Linderina macrospora]|uniref:Uncharacterized protein n=1 Tax=Linderina macrospora TaxID=4868 RepID=A0ACC1J5A9_9FUNG|nr:hypothetical protein FBU59_004613 [Linderina macrospora]